MEASAGLDEWDTTIAGHRQRQLLRIGEAAADLVAREGLSGVSMSQLARTIGISRATLYNYVPDVATAIYAYLGARAEEFQAAVTSAVAEEVGPEAKLRRYVHEQVAYIASTDHRAAVALVEAGAALGGSGSASAHQRHHSATLEVILDHGAREGVFRFTSNTAQTVLISRLLYSAHELLHQHHLTVDETASAITELILDGVRLAASRPGDTESVAVPEHPRTPER